MLSGSIILSVVSEDKFEIGHKLTKYLKENCRFDSELHLSLKYFLKNAWYEDIGEIVREFSTATGTKWVNSQHNIP